MSADEQPSQPADQAVSELALENIDSANPAADIDPDASKSAKGGHITATDTPAVDERKAAPAQKSSFMDGLKAKAKGLMGALGGGSKANEPKPVKADTKADQPLSGAAFVKSSGGTALDAKQSTDTASAALATAASQPKPKPVAKKPPLPPYIIELDTGLSATTMSHRLGGLNEGIDPAVRKAIYMQQLEQPYAGNMTLSKSTIPAGSYTTGVGETLLSIAERHLGPSFSPGEHEAYVREIQQVNGLPGQTEAPPRHSLVLPGHTADGGFIITDGGRTLTKYRSGQKIFETAELRKFTQIPAADGTLTEEHVGPGGTDTFVATRSRDGKYKFSEKTGTRPYKVSADSLVSAAHARLHELAEKHIKDPSDRSKFEADMARFEDGGHARGLTNKEIFATYEQVMRFFDAVPKPHDRSLRAPANTWAQLALEVLSQAAEPKSICQGTYNTNDLTSIETLFWSKTPSAVTKLIADIALTGSVTAHDGTSVIIDPQSLKPHFHSSTHLDGYRSFARQLFTVTAVNLAYRSTTVNAATQNGTTKRVAKERRYAEEEIKRDVAGDNGERLYERRGDDWKLIGDSPALDDDQLIGVYQLILGKTPEAGTAGGVMISHREGINGNGSLVDIIVDEASLADKLKTFNYDGNLPVIARVHTTNEPFFTESFNEPAGCSGSWHYLVIIDFEHGKVEIDNQWQSNSEQRIFTMSVHDLYLAMRSPEATLDELQRQVEANRESGKIETAKELMVVHLQHRIGYMDDESYGREVARRMLEANKRWEIQKADGSLDEHEQERATQRLDSMKALWKRMFPAVAKSFDQHQK